MTIVRGQQPIHALPPEAPQWAQQLQSELSQLAERLQNGGLELSGVKLDILRTAIPTTGPERGQPNLLVINLAGVHTLHIWNGTNWVPV